MKLLCRGASTLIIALVVHVSEGCELEGDPPLLDDHRSRDYTTELIQYIVTSYSLSCHGYITSWSACVEPGGNRERYHLRFHVWRPSNSSCFSLIGTNVPSELLAPQDHCVHYSVPQEEQIEVLPGDVVGFYADRYKLSRRKNDLDNPDTGGVQLDTQWSGEGGGGVSLLYLSTGPVVTEIGREVCQQTQLSSSNRGAPVLSANIVAVPTINTSSVAVEPLTSTSSVGIKPLTSTEASTAVLAQEETSLPPSPSSSSILFSHTPLSSSPSPPPPPPLPPPKSSHAPLPHKPSLSSYTITSSPITSSFVIMTSSSSTPTPLKVSPADEEGLPPILIGGLVMAAILAIAIICLIIILLIMLLWKPRRVKEKVDCEENDNMVYSAAYEQPNGYTSDQDTGGGGDDGMQYGNGTTQLGTEWKPEASPELKDLQEKVERDSIYDDNVMDTKEQMLESYVSMHHPSFTDNNEYEEIF